MREKQYKNGYIMFRSKVCTLSKTIKLTCTHKTCLLNRVNQWNAMSKFTSMVWKKMPPNIKITFKKIAKDSRSMKQENHVVTSEHKVEMIRENELDTLNFQELNDFFPGTEIPSWSG